MRYSLYKGGEDFRIFHLEQLTNVAKYVIEAINKLSSGNVRNLSFTDYLQERINIGMNVLARIEVDLKLTKDSNFKIFYDSFINVYVGDLYYYYIVNAIIHRGTPRLNEVEKAELRHYIYYLADIPAYRTQIPMWSYILPQLIPSPDIDLLSLCKEKSLHKLMLDSFLASIHLKTRYAHIIFETNFNSHPYIVLWERFIESQPNPSLCFLVAQEYEKIKGYFKLYGKVDDTPTIRIDIFMLRMMGSLGFSIKEVKAQKAHEPVGLTDKVYVYQVRIYDVAYWIHKNLRPEHSVFNDKGIAEYHPARARPSTSYSQRLMNHCNTAIASVYEYVNENPKTVAGTIGGTVVTSGLAWHAKDIYQQRQQRRENSNKNIQTLNAILQAFSIHCKHQVESQDSQTLVVQYHDDWNITAEEIKAYIRLSAVKQKTKSNYLKNLEHYSGLSNCKLTAYGMQ